MGSYSRYLKRNLGTEPRAQCVALHAKRAVMISARVAGRKWRVHTAAAIGRSSSRTRSTHLWQRSAKHKPAARLRRLKARAKSTARRARTKARSSARKVASRAKSSLRKVRSKARSARTA